MKVLADKYLYKIEGNLPEKAELDLFDPDNGFPKNATDADALLIRTVTKINHDTLPRAGRLRFIGSATAGFDHVDKEYLEKLGLAFSNSEGCNANAVGEYVITCLLKWAEDNQSELRTKKVGVIGCGHTGGRVIHYLKQSGIDMVLYDPPKAVRETSFQSATADDVLSCDILTFHTPLEYSGPHPTHHLCNEKWLQHRFDLIINTARGGVVDEKAMLQAKESGTVRDFILDVWENEPVFLDEAARQAFIATPHIAGYSKQAKYRATKMVVDEMIRFFGLEKSRSKNDFEKSENLPVIDEKMSFPEYLWQNTNISFYDNKLREMIGLNDSEKALKFAKLRSETETRNEFESVIKTFSDVSRLPTGSDIFKSGL